jgi:hypothetical protein
MVIPCGPFRPETSLMGSEPCAVLDHLVDRALVRFADESDVIISIVFITENTAYDARRNCSAVIHDERRQWTARLGKYC